MAITLKKYISKKGKDIPNLYIDEVSGNFYARKRIGDKTPRISLETNIESTAVLKLYQAIKEMEEKELFKTLSEEERKKEEQDSNRNKLVRDFYKMAMEEKERLEVRAATVRRIDTIWRNNIEPFCGDMKPSEIIDPNAKFVDDFMKWHRKALPGVQFVNTFKYLGNIFRVMAENGAIPFDKIPKLELPKTEVRHHQAKKGRIITDEEYKNIHSRLAEEYRPILQIAFYMGMRKMEIGLLTGNKIIKADDHYFFDFKHEDTKTGIERTPPIPDFLVPTILRLKTQAGSGYLFPSPQDATKPITSKSIDAAWRRAKLNAKIEGKMRFHDIRHTRATALVKTNQNPLLIATHLGMTIKTLQDKYLKLDSKDLLALNRSLVDLNERGDQ